MMNSANPEPRTLEQLKTACANGWQPGYLFFWGHTPKNPAQPDKSCLSNWFPAAFELDGVRYPTTEHHMMAEKARLFRDEDALARILAAPTPGEAKALGRKVRGFVAEPWSARAFDVVVAGNEAKFSQHPSLGEFLLGTGSMVLVEASPVDMIWGIGLAQDHPAATQPERWQGLNQLGFVLMEVRARLRLR